VEILARRRSISPEGEMNVDTLDPKTARAVVACGRMKGAANVISLVADAASGVRNILKMKAGGGGLTI
jgi:hypothetical protein